MYTWLIGTPTTAATFPSGEPPELFRAREQIMTGMMRVAAVGGLISFIAAVPPVVQLGLYGLLVGYAVVLALAWVLALNRQLAYRLRGGALVAGIYILAANELLSFGYSVDAHIYLVAFTLFPLLFFGWRAGVAALLTSVATLALMGWSIVSGAVVPPNATGVLTSAIVVSACLNFLMIAGALQAGMFTLLQSLAVAWTRESQARALLEHERDQLEQRVAARTQELAAAHAATSAANHLISEQNTYLSALYDATLDLLNRRTLPDVFQAVVDRASAILCAPYGELMLSEGDELVVHAFTANQPFLVGDRVRRGEAEASWQAFDTRQPVVIDDYASWLARRTMYDQVSLSAIADFPIIVGDTVVGVLAMGRATGSPPFTPVHVRQGQLLSQLLGLVLERARLDDLLVAELRERTHVEALLRGHVDLLNAQNAELDAFAHTIAHDLKTPLAGIIGYTDLLLLSVEMGQTSELDSLGTSISMAGRKMAQIIDDILLLASVRTRADVPSARLDMGRIVYDVERRLARQIATAQATVSCPATWPSAYGYAPWVEEVWINYVSNALKYSGQPPRIELGADDAQTGAVRFWVRDHGPGLNEDQQARLFTSFTRLHLDVADGHGLGLSIVQRIVTRLGGEVGVSSTPGDGCLFFFTLPREPDRCSAHG